MLWDAVDPDVFAACDGADCGVYIFIRGGLDGDTLLPVGAQPVPSGYTPVALHNGVMHCRCVTAAPCARAPLGGAPGQAALPAHQQLVSLSRAAATGQLPGGDPCLR